MRQDRATHGRRARTRWTLIGLLSAFALVAAACSSTGSTSTTDTTGTTQPTQQETTTSQPDPGTTPTTTAAPSGDDQLEVLNWWTSGGELAALNALFAEFEANNPGVEVINAAIAGGGGSAARPVLQTRLAGGNPPDSWPAHPGFELLDQYAEAGYTQGLADLYEEEGWFDVIPQDILTMMEYNGEPQQVLTGVHRGNGLWYNKAVLDKQGITIGDTLSVDQFFTIAEQLQGAGITPLCVGDTDIWASAELFENTLVGVIGPDAYLGLWSGATSFDSPEVKKAIETYGRMLDFQNNDHAALSWDQAIVKLQEGSCVFNSMGDWAYGEFAAAGLTENVDFGWVSHPGTAGTYVIVADGFSIPKNPAHPIAAREWLRTVGSLDAQVAFNQKKGSICARTDCPREEFSVYHNWAMDSFANDALVPTVVHGSAAAATFQQALNDAVTLFVTSRDVDAMAASLAAAAKESGIGS